MLLDRALETLTIWAWVLLGLFVLTYLLRALWRDGLGAAIRRLFSQRLLFVVLFFIMALTLLSQSLVFIEPPEVGVVVSLIAPEGYRDRPLRSGLHTIVPLMEQVYRYPIYWQTYTMASKPMEGQKVGNDAIVARTSDGQQVSLDCSVIFQIDAEQAIRVHIDWQTRYIEDFIRPVLRGLVRTLVSQYTVDEVNSFKRLDLENDLAAQVQAALEDKGFVMDRFVLRNITFSPEYAASVELKQVALQNITQKKHEADQIREYAKGEADRIKLVAEAEARAIEIKAQAEANALKLIADALARHPDLITYRYVDKLAPSVRVMLVPNNMPYILPLPSLEAGAVTTPTTSGGVTSTLPVTPTLPPFP